MGQSEKEIVKMDNYLKSFSITNYKSVKNLEIDFKPGLNIIIGKNASGKTNFISALNSILKLSYDSLNETVANLKLKIKDKKIEIKTTTSSFKDTLSHDDWVNTVVSFDYCKNLNTTIIEFKLNDISVFKKDTSEIIEYLREQSCGFLTNKINYGIPYIENPHFVDQPKSFVLFQDGHLTNEIPNFIKESKPTIFLESFLFRLFLKILRGNRLNSKESDQEWKNEIIKYSEENLININNYIFQFTPIECARINPDFNLIIEENGKKVTATNLYLEFRIDKDWIPFNFLSDGTKRLFYIISEILARDPLVKTEDEDLIIVLLEEPELGIHPHQLHKLLQFIREQSREKQIILTTHSPQVLDILEPNELDRIIICSYDKEKGTQLNHLTQKQMDKAAKYMKEEAFLSDYWRFSDLEPAS
jgi:AAA15 family ATPase/GTPase